MEDKITWVDFDVLENFMRDVFVQMDVPKEDAEIVADVLISADKRGIDSHGIGRFKPIYVDRIDDGILNVKTKIDIIKESPTTALLDGNDGLGHVISKKAMEMAIKKAEMYGMGMVVVRNSSHYGFAGYYPLMAVENNMIGITGTNARPSIAPTFGVENMLGTNPLTVGMPSDEEFPFLLDCATSISQRGKIEKLAREGKETPAGWVIGRDGTARTDTEEILKDLVKGKAALSPLGGIGEELGGYKGYGYATVVEILSSALQGGIFLKALSGYDSEGKKQPYHLGHFFIVINIESFIEPEEFKKTTGEILRQLRNSEKMPKADKIYTAGEKEYIAWKERKHKGAPLNRVLREQLVELRDRFSLDYKFDFE
ncbi:MAG TPA: lactate dehydrogenase [Clostridiales bacterium]|jgi:LDH2 family malate/lactate/ureidoglycolate dehydrogenase|nr:lactate dehydrogenase [Clostridiales bacterium]